jgi:hypothetical protein
MRTTWLLALLGGCALENVLHGKPDDEAPGDAPGDEPPVEPPLTESGGPVGPVDSGGDVDSGGTLDTGGLVETATDSAAPIDTGTPPGSSCLAPVSWRDSLPPLPPPVALPNTLPAGAGVALSNCTGAPTAVPAASPWGTFSSDVAHNGGQWYFEVVLPAPPSGNFYTGVRAAPIEESYLNYPFVTQSWAMAGFPVGGLVVVGIAADLDAGIVGYYENGTLVGQADVSLDPGVGAFHAAGQSFDQGTTFNFGTDPFRYDPPAGYSPWAFDPSGGGGVCPTDPDVPAPPAPVTLSNTGGYVPTTFLSDANDPVDLVMVTAYEPVGGAFGAIDVTLRRSRPVVLVLDSFRETVWNVTVDPAADLRGVWVYGVAPTTINGVPAGVPLTTRPNSWAAHQWPHHTGGCDTQGAVEAAERDTCLPLKIFAGVYALGQATID